jgi:hypothetical protein
MQSVCTEKRVDRRGWHLDKTVGVTHLITTLTIVVSVLAWANTIDKRITLIEAEAQHQRETDNRQDAVLRESLAAIRDTLREMKETMNRIDERSRGH